MQWIVEAQPYLDTASAQETAIFRPGAALECRALQKTQEVGLFDSSLGHFHPSP